MRQAAMQSTVHSVFSISASVASGTIGSVLEAYGVIKYEERADRRPPSPLPGDRVLGTLLDKGIVEDPPRKSSMRSIGPGRSECRNRTSNNSKIWMS